MTPRDKATELARAWHEKALGDLVAARSMAANENVPAWILGFHLQQAIEKAWKGRLVILGLRPAPVHDLRAILEARPGRDLPSPAEASMIVGLQAFAVEERYPLLTPRAAPRAPLEALLPLVEGEVAALAAAIASGGGDDDPDASASQP
jgi:HEPN domain-containing protein